MSATVERRVRKTTTTWRVVVYKAGKRRRFTFASWALESGKSIKWVQSMLGHSSPELTLRTYSHLMKSEGDEMGWLEAPEDVHIEKARR